MDIEQVAELARAVAGLPQAERDYFDGMVADKRAKAADEARIAELRAMGGYAVVRVILNECTAHAASYDPATALRRIGEAGFVRMTDISDEEAVKTVCFLVRNVPLVRMLIGLEAAQALFNELAKDAAQPEAAA